MAIRSFADTSAVSIAYGFSDAANSGEWVSADMFYVPSVQFEIKVNDTRTTEGFTIYSGIIDFDFELYRGG